MCLIFRGYLFKHLLVELFICIEKDFYIGTVKLMHRVSPKPVMVNKKIITNCMLKLSY